MEQRDGWLIRTVRVIDAISTVSGHIVAWLVLPLIAIMSYELTVRYMLNPTLWAYDLSYMLYGAMFMLGTAYTLRRGAHIRTDFLYQDWPVRSACTHFRNSATPCSSSSAAPTGIAHLSGQMIGIHALPTERSFCRYERQAKSLLIQKKIAMPGKKRSR